MVIFRLVFEANGTKRKQDAALVPDITNIFLEACGRRLADDFPISIQLKGSYAGACYAGQIESRLSTYRADADRILSPATPVAPMSILLLPVVRSEPA